MDDLKPPLGVAPYWIAIPARIKDLAEAIIRCSNDTGGKQLGLWAYEIKVLSEANAKITNYRKDNGIEV